MVPPQPGGGHDGPQAPPFSPGDASGAPTLPAGLPAPGGQPWLPGTPPAKPRRSVGLVITSVLAALLLVVSGVMGYLWWDTSNELDQTRSDLNAQIDELNATVDARDGEIDRLSDELEETQDALADAEIELEGTSNMVDSLEEDKDIIRECILLLNEVYVAIEDGDLDRAERLDREAEDVCAEADRALGF
jgi:septal ring factor EnvC (AmiA/AmiB activator)